MSDILQDIDNLIEETFMDTLSSGVNYIKQIPRKVLRFAGDTVKNAAEIKTKVGIYSPEKIGRNLRKKWDSGSRNTTKVNPDLDKQWGKYAYGAAGLGALGTVGLGAHLIGKAIFGPGENENSGLGLGKIGTGAVLGGGAVLGAQHLLKKEKENQTQ